MLLQKLLELTKNLKKSKIKPKGLLNVFADTETSYINNTQILIADPHKRERYADMLGYYITEVENGFSKNNDDFKYFTGKDCIEKFLIEMFKLVFSGNTTKVWWYNLDYDWKYINYILSLAGITNKNNQGFEVETLRNENVLYQVKITYRQKSSRKKYKKVYLRDENGKYLLNEKGNKIYKKEEILDENGNVVYEENVYSLIFNDAMKLFAGGVDALGDAIGFKKLEFEYNNVRDYNYVYSEEEIEYLKRDCYIVKETFVQSTLINQLCNVSNKFTIGGCAFSKYVNEFLPTHINGKDFRDKNGKVKFESIFPNYLTCKDSIPSRDSQGELTNKYYTLDYIFSVIYDGYFGGLSQCNPINQGKIIINENSEFKDWLLSQATIKGREIILTPKREITIDINSLYPFIMYIAKIPYGMPSIIEYPTEEQLKEIIKGKKFVLVEIDNIYGDLKQNKMPIIPKNRNNKLNTNCNYEQTLYGKSLIRNYTIFRRIIQHR